MLKILAVTVALMGVANATTFEQNHLDKRHVEALRQALEVSVKDPTSVIYTLPPLKPGKAGVQSYCGCYNAKNSLGAYTGRHVFFGAFVTMGKDLSFLPTGNDEDINRTMCVKSDLELPC